MKLTTDQILEKMLISAIDQINAEDIPSVRSARLNIIIKNYHDIVFAPAVEATIAQRIKDSTYINGFIQDYFAGILTPEDIPSRKVVDFFIDQEANIKYWRREKREERRSLFVSFILQD